MYSVSRTCTSGVSYYIVVLVSFKISNQFNPVRFYSFSKIERRYSSYGKMCTLQMKPKLEVCWKILISFNNNFWVKKCGKILAKYFFAFRQLGRSKVLERTQEGTLFRQMPKNRDFFNYTLNFGIPPELVFQLEV